MFRMLAIAVSFFISASLGLPNRAVAQQAAFIQSDKSNAQQNLNNYYTKCAELSAEIVKTKRKFMSVCAGSNNSEKSCKETLNECAEDLGSNEQSTDTILGNTFVEETKKCTKYSQDQLDQKIEKMETKLDSKNKNLKDLQKDKNKDAEDYTSKSTKILEEAQKLQKDKNQKDFEDAEREREATAKSESDTQSMQAKIREIDSAIFKAQQQQALLTSQRGKEINSYRMAIIKCKDDVRKLAKTMESNTAGSLALAGKRSGNKNKDLQEAWLACADNALRDRNAEADKYKVAMDSLSQEISNRTAEKEALNKSLQTKSSIEAQAKASRDKLKQQSDQALAAELTSKKQELDALIQQNQIKISENAKAISEATVEIREASNTLASYKGQNAFSQDKSLTKINEDLLSPYEAAEEQYKNQCNKEREDNLKKAVQDAPSGSATK